LTDLIKISRALLSVYDKSGLLELALALHRRGVEIISTGGTARYLQEQGIPVQAVAKVTGFPEMLGGRVKTLHPHIHGAILAKRDDEQQMRQLAEFGLAPIDLVVVNLYPFEKTIAGPDCSRADALENIDIGGPCMIRAAAKNYPGVAVLTSPEQYAAFLSQLDAHDGCTSLTLREEWATAAFGRTSRYDAAIHAYLEAAAPAAAAGIAAFPQTLDIHLYKVQDLRYGENPHQAAAFYEEAGGMAFGKQLHGKELSYNNILDINSAVGLAAEFAEPAVVIVKHNNPCGAAIGSDLLDAWEKALVTDPVSAYGGIVALNQPLVQTELAAKLAEIFLEVVVAPDFSAGVVELLQKKKNLRLIRWPGFRIEPSMRDVRKVSGGFLLQNIDIEPVDSSTYKVVSRRAPTEVERQALLFGWRVAKWVKSNAIIFTGPDRTLGIGAGQMSRVDSSRLAAMKAQSAGLDLHGTAAASDAFFPFRDGLDVLAEAGATAVIEPGGSVRDEDVIAAANEHNIALLFTGMRHFRH
jgi:phosphoribosylaminoimidazolecarboxamide formyltransferase / IMP cyclohydrolase